MDIKKVKKIGTLTNKYDLPVDIFELSPPMLFQNEDREAEYLTGGFYNKHNYPMIALYISDKNGNIIDNEPFIIEEGIPTYDELFKRENYILIY